MADAETLFETRARRAYEMGRVLVGLRRATAVVPMVGLSLLFCGGSVWTFLDAAALAVLVVLLEWRGGSYGRGARIGLWAGVPPLLLPVVAEVTRLHCGVSFCIPFPAVCLLGGVAGGALIAWWGIGRGLDMRGFAAAAAVAALAGTLGCLVAGVGGLIGLTIGLGLGATPLIVLRRA